MMLAAMPQPRHPLAALIDHVREINDWSDSDITRRATAAGFKLGKSNLSRIRNTDVVSVTASTIQGLSAGLGIPEAEVARAALLSMGIDVPDLAGIDLETAIRMDASLSVRDRALLLSTLRNMREPTALRDSAAALWQSLKTNAALERSVKANAALERQLRKGK